MFSCGDYSLLIVDDEPDLREAVAFDFRRRGFQVFTAESGMDALEVVKTQKIDLILSDVRMPQGTGIELLDRIKERSTMLPVLMLITGFTDMPVEEAYDRGADAVFAKPFDRNTVFEAVVRALTTPRERFHREEARLGLSLPLGLRFTDTGLEVPSRALGVGRGGIFVSLTDQFPLDQEPVEFRVELPFEPKTVLAGQGIVRWLRRQAGPENLPVGCGIEFSWLERASIEEFLGIVQRLQMRSFIPRK